MASQPDSINTSGLLVRGWVSGASDLANHGFLLMPVEGTPNTDALVGILDAAKLKPVLLVQYGK